MNLAQLFNPVEKIVGLETTRDHVKIVLLERNKKKGVLGVIRKTAALPPGVLRNGRVADQKAFASALKNFFQTNRSIFKSRYAILALPPAHAFTDIMRFPLVAQEQVAESIALNINTKTMFPVEAGEIYYDWQPAKSKDPYHQEIMIGFAMRDYIKNWMDACEAAGLEPLAFEASPASVARALNNFQDTAGAVLRIASEGVEISVISENELRFTRFVQMPAAGTLDEFKEFLLNELSLAFNFYAIENPRAEPVRVLAIISQLEQEKEIGDFLAARLRLSIRKAHFANGAEIDESYAAAYGAALRGLIKREKDTLISLMPIGTEETYRKRRLLAYVSLWSDIVNATAALLVVLFAATLFFLQTIEKKVDTQIAASQAASAVGEQIAALESDAARFNRAVGKLAAAEGSIYRWSSLSGKLPAALVFSDITINSINISRPGGDIAVNITAATRAAAVSFRKMLEKSGEYENVAMPFLDISQRENINITVVLRLKK